MSDKFYNKEFTSIKSNSIDSEHLESHDIKIYPGQGNLNTRKSISEMFDDMRKELLDASSHMRYTDYKSVPFSDGIELIPENGVIMDDIWKTSYFTMDNGILPNGIIKSITLYFEQQVSDKISIIVEVLDKEGNVIEEKTTRSINRQTVSTIRKGVTWYFEGLQSPDDNHILRFSFSKTKNVELDNFYKIFIDRFEKFIPTSNTDNAPYTSDFCNMYILLNGEYETVKAVPYIRFSGDFYSPSDNVNNHIENQHIHIDSFEKSIIESLYTKNYTVAFDNIKDTGIYDLSTTTTLNYSDVQACYLKRPYFTNGTFTKIEFPIGPTGTTSDSQSSTSGVYLFVYLRDKNDKIVKSYVSENSVIFRGNKFGDSFFFKGIEINENIYGIHFEVSTDKDINNNIRNERLHTSKENTFNAALFKLGETKNYGAIKRTGQYDPTGVIHVIFYKTDATLSYGSSDTSNNFSFKTSGSYDNEGNLTSVSISSGNVFLPYNQIVQIPGKENISVTPSDETQYLVLDVFRDGSGQITYKYSVKTKDEIGYTIKTATELT